MKIVGGHPRLSASDLANHLGCRYLTALDLAAAEGRIQAPVWRDPALAVLQERGLEHERAYLDHLAAGGATITRFGPDDAEGPASAFERTLEAMRRGEHVIAQATLVHGRWLGRADILRRVQRPSTLGDWSYEVTDTKLARETRGGTMLQMCLYSDIVGAAQGLPPEHMHVVAPGRGFALESYRVDDFMAYYRLVRAKLERAVDQAAVPGAAAGGAPAIVADGLYPEPVEMCGICRWWSGCDRRRRADDHLSLVAGISRSQRVELVEWEVPTMARLAALPLPTRRPSRGSREGIVRVREQARVQVEGRTRGEPVYELLERVPGQGLLRLPEPSPGDVFLDLEGDPFVGEQGLEYLFGWVVIEDGAPRYRERWALDRGAERRAFEAWVDGLMARWDVHPDLHVYHFAPYEPGAIKRLMGRFATREAEVDRLLRAERFVDLHAIVRQALRASVEQYSIKALEPFYRFAREMPLEEARPGLRAVEHALELGRADLIDGSLRATVEAYNRDDCVSALALREWLEGLRAERVGAGEDMPRPVPAAGEAPAEIGERERRIAVLASELVEGVADDAAARTPEAHARWLLAHLLDWHRREDRVKWWEYFRLRELPLEELYDERAALAGLQFVQRVATIRRSEVHRYRFPAQESALRDGHELWTASEEGRFGEIVAIDPVAGTVDVKKGSSKLGLHPVSVFEHTHYRTGVIADALERMGVWTVTHGIDADGPYRAARDLLLRRPPRLAGGPAVGTPLKTEVEADLVAAQRLARALDQGVLAIQGPPGSGKTFTGARMILDLVRAGRRVGVTANSHRVIRNLLEEVVRAAGEAGHAVGCIQKVSDDERIEDSPIVQTDDNAAVAAALADGTAQVAGGTAWLWSREDFHEAVDVLVVDEAGQLSLANAVAVAQGAKSLVLLGDPRQLDQPQQGSHPDGCGISALEHLLDGRLTVPPDRGLFLAETWRLHPDVCAFTSELFYEGRLRPRPGLECQALHGPAPLEGAGLWLLPVEHDGRRNRSTEEVEAVRRLIERLLHANARWTDPAGVTNDLTPEDILVVTPFNAQVADLRAAIPGVRAGTVDAFQGQEAPLVIYSMVTSSPEDAPRGMEFLYSLNRLNVATSRARCAAVLVASPRLFEPECRSPQQMRMANAFCRYLELARELTEGWLDERGRGC